MLEEIKYFTTKEIWIYKKFVYLRAYNTMLYKKEKLIIPKVNGRIKKIEKTNDITPVQDKVDFDNQVNPGEIKIMKVQVDGKQLSKRIVTD